MILILKLKDIDWIKKQELCLLPARNTTYWQKHTDGK
jgi:hypothetical protein